MSNGDLDPSPIPRVGVLAKRDKTLGGGLTELRRLLADAGIPDPLWVEIDRGKEVPKAARRLADQGAERVLVWGGDGTIQRTLSSVAGTHRELGILPAGTANTLAQNLGIPTDLEEAVRIALGSWTARLDVGWIGEEPFAVAAGVGFDALLVREADKTAKGKLGRVAYVVHGVRAAGTVKPVAARVKVDGKVWFEGDVTTVLVANAAALMGGLRAFPDARMDDGRLEVGVVTAAGRLDWLRLAGRMAVGKALSSPFVEATQGEKIDIRLDKKLRYEMDGGERGKVKRLRVAAGPGAVSVCVPAPVRSAASEPPQASGQAAAVAESVSGS